MNSKVLRGCLRLGVVVSLLLASSHAMGEERTCLRIDLNRAQQTSTDLVQSAIARDQLVELLAPAHRCPQGVTVNVALQKLIPSGNQQGSDSSEGEDKKDASQENKKRFPKKSSRSIMNLSRHSRRKDKSEDYDVSNHYVQEGQAFPTPWSLANDAKKIHEAVHSSQSRGGTTILCVALVDANGHVRKFSFCNHQGSMPLGCFHKAKELGYDEGSMDKEQAQRHIHAEVQFLEFLYTRNATQERYTHLLGMGCSRQHCKECDGVLRLILGNTYRDFTAAADNESRRVMSVDAPLHAAVPHVILTKQEEVAYDLVTQDQAVSGGCYEHFAIPDALKSRLAQQAGIQVTEWDAKYASKAGQQVPPALNPSQGSKKRRLEDV